MQTVSRYLLTSTVIVYQNGYHGRNSNVYNRRLQVYRGVFNPITFTFKNEDQKKQDIVGKRYTFSIIDSESKKAVVERTLKILDDGSTIESKGTASVEITEGDLLPLDAKFYEYSIKEVLTDGSTLVTYADTSYVSAGTIEVLDGAYPSFIPSTTITNFTGTGGPLAKTSGAVDARPGVNNNKALHTIAVYTQDFAGSFKVQGTMASSPQDEDYFDITLDGEASSTVTYILPTTLVYQYNFTGVFHHIRISYDNLSDNTGKIDKILYRQ
jgi:hypothetical protein